MGGRRIDSLAAVNGLSTLPALPMAGTPSTPIRLTVGRQVRFSTSSARSSDIGRVAPAKGNLA